MVHFISTIWRSNIRASICGPRVCDSERLVMLQEGRSLTIKLRKRKTEKKVEWSSDTVDNEHLGRRSSKCEFRISSRFTQRHSSVVTNSAPLRLRLLHLREAAAVWRVVVRERGRRGGGLRQRPLHPGTRPESSRTAGRRRSFASTEPRRLPRPLMS